MVQEPGMGQGDEQEQSPGLPWNDPQRPSTIWSGGRQKGQSTLSR